jgi:hypothetical protein
MGAKAVDAFVEIHGLPLPLRSKAYQRQKENPDGWAMADQKSLKDAYGGNIFRNSRKVRH